MHAADYELKAIIEVNTFYEDEIFHSYKEEAT